MAVTAKGTPYVETSDLVANYPGVSLALANHIDTIGKVLQVVRATDVTARATTSASYVDITGMTVTITPQSATSSILILSSLSVNIYRSGNTARAFTTITDASNTSISGSEGAELTSAVSTASWIALDVQVNQIAYDTPGVTTAVTYKMRFKTDTAATITAQNNINTGQMYAIEVAA